MTKEQKEQLSLMSTTVLLQICSNPKYDKTTRLYAEQLVDERINIQHDIELNRPDGRSTTARHYAKIYDNLIYRV